MHVASLDRSVIARLAPLALLLLLLGCGGPERFEPPDVDPADAAAEAIRLYDRNQDAALSADELQQCPGILARLPLYDQDNNGSVDQPEIEARLEKLFQHGVGGTQLGCYVSFQGRPLADARVTLEPEPYLGNEVQAASGTTNGSGATQLGIPPECLPSHLERLNAVHYGTFKVRVTHPTIEIPAKYNSQTQLGYETEIGNPLLRLELR
jgi:hypothetical protein